MGHSVYKVTTDQGEYNITVDEPQAATDAASNKPTSYGGLATAGAGKAVPALSRAAEEVATSPAVPRLAASAGRMIGAVAPVVEAGPIGLVASARGAWAGGKAGWFTGKLAQNVAAPIASVAAKAEPYAQALSTLSGVQSLLDMAQIADPSRKDIGVLGVSLGDKRAPGDTQPAALNALGDAFAAAIAKAPDAWMHIVNDIKQHAKGGR